MGVGMSKVDRLELVSLCEERKELIKAAVDCRYELVSAHIMYVQSFLDMGNALHRFLEEDLEIISDFSCDCSDEDSHLKFSSSDLESETDSVHEHLHFSGESSESEKDFQSGANSDGHMGNMSSGVPAGSRHRYPDPDNDDVYVPIVDTRYPQENNKLALDAPMDTSKNKVTYAPDGNWESVKNPMDFPYYYGFWPLLAPAATPSPEPAGFAWKFNPFITEVDDVYHYYNYYFQENIIGDRAESDDFEVRKIREEEGIPDLEDDTDQSIVKKTRYKKKSSEKDTNGDSGADPKNDDHVQSEQEKESKNMPDEENAMACSSSRGLIKIEQESKMDEGESSQEARSFTCNGECTETDIHSPWGLQQAVKEIKNAFETSFIYGQEVSILLEAGKLPYQTTGAKFKVLVSRLVSLAVPFAMSSQHPSFVQSSRSASKKMKSSKVVCENYKEVDRKSCHLSSTLEKLRVWEKKLYEEVKVEENLRVCYDKEWKRLKRLDDRGAESTQIDRTQASVKSLLSKIKVPVSAIEAISIRIHKIRDEELQGQVNELIIGLSRMWKLMIKCHRRQLQAIKNAETCVHVAGMHARKGPRLRAAKNLEKETWKWAARFSHYIRTQKTFVSLLNNWLLRYISEELKTLDEADRFSPGRIGAPAIFVVCNDWHNAIQNISEDGVCRAIHAGRRTPQRIKTEQLLKDLEDQYEKDAVAATQEMLDEQKAAHQEAIKLANDAASDCLRSSLPPVFETLESFCLENLKAYEKIRIPNASTSR
ncbi:nitrate regulatory gene2 protein [Salix suchowensis]|nr:nitrate regulatory gene2 protein [Salix suchowensis]